MNVTVLDNVRYIAADVFGINIEDITPQSSIDTIKSWDSLQHLNFVLALEQFYSFQFEPEDIEQMKSIEITTMIIEEKLAKN